MQVYWKRSSYSYMKRFVWFGTIWVFFLKKKHEKHPRRSVTFRAGKLRPRLNRAPAVHQKQHQGEQNNVYLKYIFISIFIINLGLQQ